MGFSMMEYMATSSTTPCEPSLGIVIRASPVAFLEINYFPKLDWLVWSGGVDAEGSFAVQPVVSATQPQPFWADHADMVWSKGLAKGTGVELVDFIVGQVCQSFIAELIGGTRFRQPFFVFSRIGIDGYLHFVDDGTEVGMETSVQNLSEVLQVETFVGGPIRDAYPGDVALSNVLDAGSAVDEVVDLPFQDRLEVLLHLPAGNLNNDAHVGRTLGRDILERRSNDIHLTIHDLVQIGHVQIFEAARVLAAKFNAHIVAPDRPRLQKRSRKAQEQALRSILA